MSSLSSASPFRADCCAGKVALVTGGGSGIGFEIARQLIQHGCRGVLICGRRANFLEKACRLLNEGTNERGVSNATIAHYHVCDVRQPRDCQAAVEKCRQLFGPQLDILVNAAAGNFLSTADQLSPKGFATVLAIDTLGTFNMCHAAFGSLQTKNKKQHNHHETTTTHNNSTSIIINISATLQCPATHWQVHASAAKAGVDSLTRSLALEWGHYGIRVCGIAPGPIANTPGTAKLAPSTKTKKKGKQKTNKNNHHLALVQQGIPLGRLGETWEIGHAVVYLTTAMYVTGDVLIVDGGEWLYRPPLVPRTMVAQLSRQVEAPSRAQGPTAAAAPSKL